MKLPLFWQRNDRSLEFKQNMALSQAQADANVQGTPEDLIQAIEKQRLFLQDEKVIDFLWSHPELHAFIPALSAINRTTKHISKKDALIAWLDFQILFTMEEMAMPPELYEAGALELMQGLEILAATQISDGYEGWKGTILTQIVKRSQIELKK